MRSSLRSDALRRTAAEWLRSARGAPVLILLLAMAVRLLRLGDANVWWDEGLAVWAVRKGLAGMTAWTAGDVHPPLYFWSLWAWIQLAGESEFAIRALSVGFGVLTVAAVYRLGRAMAGTHVGALAAALTALSRFHIWWSQETRMYALAGLMGVFSLYCFLGWLRMQRMAGGVLRAEKRSAGWPLALYVGASVGAVYTIYLMGVIVLVENLVVLIALSRPRVYDWRSILPRWILAQAAIGLTLAIWMLPSWGKMRTWSVSEPLSARAFVRIWATLLATGVSVHIERYSWLVILPFALVGIGAALYIAGLVAGGRVDTIASDRGASREPGAMPLEPLTLLLVTVLSASAIYVASIPRGLVYTPDVEARYFVPFAPSFWLLLAWSIVLIIRRWRVAGGACLVAVLTLSVLLLPGYYRDRILRDELQSLMRAIVSQAEPGDAVVLDSGSRYPVFLYYYDRLPGSAWRPPMMTVSNSEDPLTSGEVARRLADLSGSYRRFWLAEVDVGITDPDRLVRSWLDQHHSEAWARAFGPNVLYLFGPDGRAPTLTDNGYEPIIVRDMRVGTSGRLLGWDLPVKTLTPGDTIRLALHWEQVPDTPVAVELRNRHGQTVTRRRAGVPNVRRYQRQQFDLDVHPGLANGEHALVLTAQGTTDIEIAEISIERAATGDQAGAPAWPLDLRLGKDIRLEGYSLGRADGRGLERILPGDTLVVDLYWHAGSTPGQNYKVFAHLLGEAHNPRTDGPVWGQHDSHPAYDGSPTGDWVRGDSLVDRHLIVVDADAPAGAYRVEVGMYRPESGERLPVVSSDGRLLGDHVVFEAQLRVGKR